MDKNENNIKKCINTYKDDKLFHYLVDIVVEMFSRSKLLIYLFVFPLLLAAEAFSSIFTLK